MTAAPPEWETAFIGDVTVKPLKCEPVNTGRETVQYVDIGLLDGPTEYLTQAPEVHSESAPSRCRQVIAVGDTLYSTVRPYLRKIAFVHEGLNGAFASTGYCVLRPSQRIHPRFLYYFTLSKQFEDQILPLQKGVSYPAVLDREVRAQRIWYPGLAEQRRIVEIVEEHLSSLGAAQGSLRDAYSRLEALRAAALHARVVGPLVQLGDVAIERGYGTSTKCVVDGPGLPVARIPNVIRGRLDMSDEKRAASLETDLSQLLVRCGDLLIIRTNGSRALIGRAALIEQDADIAFASYLIRYRLNTTRMSPAWALAALESPRVREAIEAAAASSAGQHNLSIAKLDALRLPCPALEDQIGALAWLERIDAQALRLRQAIDNLASRSSSLRRATLAAAFQGKLTGRSTDSNVIEEMANA